MPGQFSVADPFLMARFWVEIAGIANAFFTECSGLNAETEIFEYAEGGLNDYVHKLPVRTRYSNIVLKRGWVETDELWKWFEKTISGQIETKSVSILVFENRGVNPSSPKARWDLLNAYPIKWQGPEFNASDETIAVETLEFAHHGWKRQ